MHYVAYISKEGRHTLAEFPDCPGCQTFSDGEDLDEVVREALEGWLEAHLVDGQVPPRPVEHTVAPPGKVIARVPVRPDLAAVIKIRWAQPFCQVTVETQVESLKALQEGWPAYSSESLEWFSKLLTGLLDGFQLPRPYIYPTREGAVRVEWSCTAWEIISIFDTATRSVDVIAARNDSDELHELTVPFTEPGGESRLGRFLTNFAS